LRPLPFSPSFPPSKHPAPSTSTLCLLHAPCLLCAACSMLLHVPMPHVLLAGLPCALCPVSCPCSACCRLRGGAWSSVPRCNRQKSSMAPVTREIGGDLHQPLEVPHEEAHLGAPSRRPASQQRAKKTTRRVHIHPSSAPAAASARRAGGPVPEERATTKRTKPRGTRVSSKCGPPQISGKLAPTAQRESSMSSLAGNTRSVASTRVSVCWLSTEGNQGSSRFPVLRCGLASWRVSLPRFPRPDPALQGRRMLPPLHPPVWRCAHGYLGTHL
jgi:hypothetical protein